MGRWKFAGACVLAVVLVCLAYINSFENSFHFDDSHVIENNIYIRSLRNIPRFFVDAYSFSSLPQNATYRPLVTLTLAIDYAVTGSLRPWPFHLTQLLLLLVIGWMLTDLYRDILDRADAGRKHLCPALFVATLFCVHTAATETMNLISARSELLATIGILGAFLVYIHFPGSRKYHLYLIPMILGSLAKATVVVFAPLLLVYILLLQSTVALRKKKKIERRMTLAAAIRATWVDFVVAGLLLWFLGAMNVPEWTSGGGDRVAYLRTQPWVWLHYGRLFLWPVGLSADTDLRPFDRFLDPRLILGLLFVSGLVWMIRKSSRMMKTRPIAFGLSWFGITLLPTSSFFPLAEVANEHRTFMPFIGAAVAVVWGLILLVERMPATLPARAVLGLAICVLAVHAAGTFRRNQVWRSEETLWLDVIRKSPTNGRALMNYGLTQMEKGQLAVARDFFLKARTYTPNYSTLEINLGIVLDRLGDRAGAETHFLRALELSPDSTSHFYFARWLVARGRAPEAVPHLQEALRLSPASSDARSLLMAVYAARDSRNELRHLALSTLKVDSKDPMARAYSEGRFPVATETSYDLLFRLGATAIREERFVDAAQLFRAALQLQAESADAWNNLGWSLAKLGFFEEGIAALEKALELQPDFTLAKNNLAWARSQIPRTGS